ncbi:MAG: 2OG-Fe(II) oxygenase [Myxococcales bacterium]|nr:2OG-Fe(II) oxygenase [Polyangiaceae bacterium]MDW8250223.1 2OG-Fe(II) oxygenase [Myxococcales bacterium]
MSTATILDLPWEAAPRGFAALQACLTEHLGLCLRGALPKEDCRRYSEGVLAGRAYWNSDFGGEQFSLGRAWYTHLEQGKSQDYFANARESNSLVEQFVPGLTRWMYDRIEDLVGTPALLRRGWCGPGVHIFPAGEWVARHGGVIHADIEGLTEAHVDERAPALSLVVMLQPPEAGGGLRLWDALHYEDNALDPKQVAHLPHATVTYEAGDLVVFDSYRLHQIQPFQGTTDRLSMTAHAAPFRPDRWEVWF